MFASSVKADKPVKYQMNFASLRERSVRPATGLAPKAPINNRWRGIKGKSVKSNRFIGKLAAALLFAATAPAFAAELPLIPWPAHVQPQTGQFVLNDQTAVITDAGFTNETDFLARELHLKNPGAADKNTILLTRHGADGLGAEAYRLEVTPAGVIIHAPTAAGAFYGGQTLRQLLDPSARTIPGVTIADAPRYAWRGFMVDVSRHFFDKPTLLRVLDWMADYKLNRLHLHLSDDQAWRLEIGKYPDLTRTGARGNFSDSNAPACFLTRADMQEIVAAAQARHIAVVPEIDMPGHAAAATRTYPELAGGEQTFNPGADATYDFLQNVLLSVMDICPSPWVHFGGDEVKSYAWKTNAAVIRKMQQDGLKTTGELEQSFVRHMAGFIRQQGRQPVGWDEIVAAKPAAGTLVFWWRHDKPEVLARALAEGYPVVLTPRDPCYFDYPQNENFPALGRKLYNTLATVYRGPIVPETIPAAQRQQIQGVEACLWTERIATVSYLEFMTLPRLPALAEMAWTPDSGRDFTKFEERLKPFLTQYRQEGIHFYDESNPQLSLRVAKQLPPTPATRN